MHDTQLVRDLQRVFFLPFTSSMTPKLPEGRSFKLATVCDAYPQQNDLADTIADHAKKGVFENLILCSGDIKTGMLPIGGVNFWRLIAEERLGPDFAKRVIYDPRSENSITDFTIPLEHAKRLSKEGSTADNGKQDEEMPIFCMPIFTRPFHAIRCWATAEKKTPELKTFFIFGKYAGSDMNSWNENTEFMAWMWSELPRLVTYSDKGDIAFHPMVSNQEITELHKGLEKHLREDLNCDPSSIARGVPAPTKPNGEIQIIHGGQELPAEPVLLAQNPKEMARLDLAIRSSMEHPYKQQAYADFLKKVQLG